MEQAVIVHLRFSDCGFGTPHEREAMYALEEQLEQAIKVASAGEFYGDEFGEGECVFFMYGPNADDLYQIIEPVLNVASLAAGGYAIKRYGDTFDLNASEVRVTW